MSKSPTQGLVLHSITFWGYKSQFLYDKFDKFGGTSVPSLVKLSAGSSKVVCLV